MSLGHDLWSFDESDDFQQWCGDWTAPKTGFGLFVEITYRGGEPRSVAVSLKRKEKPRPSSLGLAPLVAREIFQVILGLCGRGVSILLVEQNARAALQIADEGYVLETGEVSLAGAARDLAQDPRVVETYLGLGSGATRDPRAP